jgi:hypothetical protein
MDRTTPHREAASPLGRRSNRFRSRSLGAAAVGLAATASSEPASAAIISNLMVTATSPNGTFHLDPLNVLLTQLELNGMNMGGNWDLKLEATTGAMMAVLSTVQLYVLPARMDNDLVEMARGESVNDLLVYASDSILVKGGVPRDGWSADSIGYAGFSFVNGSTTTYGWIEIQLSAGLDQFAVTKWAYEATGGPITVGAVPEPGTALLLGLGGLGLSALGLKRLRPPVISPDP